MKRRRPVLELHTNSTYTGDGSNSSSIPSSAILGLECKSLVDYGRSENHAASGKNAIDSAMAWQVCVDETTGYTYYWNMVTNQVTWDMPPEYAAYENMAQSYDSTGFTDESKTNQLLKISEDYHNASIDSLSKTPNCKNGKNELFPAYGPLPEDEINWEETEAKKMASARKRLLSYKIDKLKNKLDEPAKEISVVNNHNSVVTAQKTDGKILFVPTPDEVKEHPIFSNSSALQMSNHAVKVENKCPEINQTQGASNQRNDGNNKLRLIAENYSDSDEGDDDEDEEGDGDLDDMIIARLREKALLLKNLGGDVPKEMMSILDETKSASDIINELEREMTVPTSNERSASTQNASSKITSDPKPVQLSSVKSSDNNSRLSDLMNDARSLFAGRKTKQAKVQKIKLSARAKELIKTSLLTAKARATNFVETEDGLKPAEEVARINEEKTAAIVTEVPTTAPETEQRPYLNDLEKFQKEIDQLSSTVKNEVVPNLPSSDNTGVENNESNCSAARKNEDDRFSFQKSFVVLNPKRPKVLDDLEKRQAPAESSSLSKYVSLVNKCDEFLESVKKSTSIDDAISNQAKSPPPTPPPARVPSVSPPPSDDFSQPARIANSHGKTTVEDMDIDIDEVLNTKTEYSDKSITDLSQLIMEKLKFLSNSKDDVAPVQVMAIQIETLVGAWQNGSLNSQYLSDWLDASIVHLRSIEDSASPPGWSCEWDRSYGRYYYRNLKTGAIQWDFPENEEPPESPPPPPDVEEMVPPPPPIISCDRESRKRKPSPPRKRLDSDGKVSRITTRDPSPTVAPSPSLDVKLTAKQPSVKPLPLMPPPLPSVPPPSSPPPPPPPPPPLTPTIEQLPVKEPSPPNNRIHEALDSFYSDLATIEESLTNKDNEAPQTTPAFPPSLKEEKNESVSSSNQRGNVEEKVVKKKKKTVKLDSCLSLKKKGLQGLVAKWQNVNSSL